MVTPALVPDSEAVYRGMRNANWVNKRGVINYRAFMLRPATDRFPAEVELSLGLNPASAVDELQEHHGIGGLLVMAIHNLPHNLTVAPDPQNATKAQMFGLPLHSTDQTQRDLAITAATDLAGLSHLLPANTVQ